MNNLGSSAAVKAMIETARQDGPNVAARAKIWTGVSGAVGAAAAGSGAAVGLAKMMATGTLFGGAVTVGVAAALLYIGSARGPVESHLARASATTAVARFAASLPAPTVMPTEAPTALAPAPASLLAVTATTTTELTPRAKAPTSLVGNPSRPYDSLAREASLVASAQAALVRGDAATALRTIELTRTLPARQLDPEELAVRAQALRALGKRHEADEADTALKSNYPLSALVRSR